MSDQPEKQPQQPANTPDKAEHVPTTEEKQQAANNGSAVSSDSVVKPQGTPAKSEPPTKDQPPAKTDQEASPVPKPEVTTSSSPTESEKPANTEAPKPEPTRVKSDASTPPSPPAEKKPADAEAPKPEPARVKSDASMPPSPPAEKKPAEGKALQETVKGEPLTASPTRKLEIPPPLVPPVSAKPEASTKSPAAKPAETAPAQGPSTAPLPDSLRTNVPPKPPTTSAGQICPNCGHLNRPGILFCENCGTNLMTGKQPAIGTRDLQRDQQTAAQDSVKLLDTSETKAIDTAGSSTFTENMVLRVEIEGAATPMLVYPKQEIILGRRDPNTGAMPDVDLTAYAGYRMGVSRRHAAIRFQDRQLNVSDLGSSNGTFLNGTRLNAHRPYQLRDGDEIRLGQMVLRLFFQANQK